MIPDPERGGFVIVWLGTWLGLGLGGLRPFKSGEDIGEDIGDHRPAVLVPVVNEDGHEELRAAVAVEQRLGNDRDHHDRAV